MEDLFQGDLLLFYLEEAGNWSWPKIEKKKKKFTNLITCREPIYQGTLPYTFLFNRLLRNHKNRNPCPFNSCSTLKIVINTPNPVVIRVMQCSKIQTHLGLDSVATRLLSHWLLFSCISMNNLLSLSVSFHLIKKRILPRVILRIQKGMQHSWSTIPFHSTNSLPFPLPPLLQDQYVKETWGSLVAFEHLLSS